jgi:hypoxanthine phosphoribosyltransferase
MITIENLSFQLFLSEKDILEKIQSLSKQIEEKYQDKNPLFICVLKGGFMFSSELLRNFNFDYELAFVRVKSYDGTQSANEIKEFYGLESNLENRHVVILEDIVETGFTTHYLISKINTEKPASVAITTMLYKPNKLEFKALPIEHVCFEIADEFVVGFGLDYNEKGRNLRSIYQLTSS